MSSHHSIPVFSEMFRPPVNHAMRVLDRTFFNKRVPLTAARVLDNKQISQCRAELGDAMLHLERLANVRPDPEAGSAKSGKKSLLLRPDIRFDGMHVVVLPRISRLMGLYRLIHMDWQATGACEGGKSGCCPV